MWRGGEVMDGLSDGGDWVVCGPRGLVHGEGGLQMLDRVEPGGWKSLVGEASEQGRDPHLRCWRHRLREQQGHSQGGAAVCTGLGLQDLPGALGIGTPQQASFFFLDFLCFP